MSIVHACWCSFSKVRDSSHSCEFQRDHFRPCQGRGEGVGVGLGLRGKDRGVQEGGVGQDHPGGAVASPYQIKEEALANRDQEGEVIQVPKGGGASQEGGQELPRSQRSTRKRSLFSRAPKSLSGRYPRDTVGHLHLHQHRLLHHPLLRSLPMTKRRDEKATLNAILNQQKIRRRKRRRRKSCEKRRS